MGACKDLIGMVKTYQSYQKGSIWDQVIKVAEKEIEELDTIKKARDVLWEARKIRCTCSSFVIQYDGCGCERHKEIVKATNDFWNIINNL